jgi:hypothetical protein
MLTIENVGKIVGQQYRNWIITQVTEQDIHYAFTLDAPNGRVAIVSILRKENKEKGYWAAVLADGHRPALLDTYFKREEMETPTLFTHNLVNWLEENSYQWQGVF